MKSASRNSGGPHRSSPSAEPIRDDELLPVRLAMSRLGWGASTLREAIKDGLQVLDYGAHRYVTGAAIIDFLSRQPTVNRNRGGGRPDLVAKRVAGDVGNDDDDLTE